MHPSSRRVSSQRRRIPYPRILAGVAIVLASGLLLVASGGIGLPPGEQEPTLQTTPRPPVSMSPEDGPDGPVTTPRNGDVGVVANIHSPTDNNPSPLKSGPRSSAGFANGAANRSPPRPVVPIKGNGSPPSDATIAVQSWALDGSPRTSPKWTLPLAQAAKKEAGTYAQLVEAIFDPWMILVVWVPSRFMGPQKVGRKANGDIMIPPTKGRDITVYLQEYNASWHTSFTSDGMEYHAQVVHRNAVAVCIRERLHLNALHLQPTTEEQPLLVYHCPCRHCSEGVLGTTAGPKPTKRLSEASPAYTSPSQTAGNMVLPDTVARISAEASKAVVDGRSLEIRELRSEGICLGGDAAPWLVPHTSTKGTPITFPYEGKHDSLRELLAVQADPLSGAIMVVIFNKFWIDHLHNYVFSMVHRAQFKHYIVATMDSEALSLCIKNRLPCFDATALAELEIDMVAMPPPPGINGSSSSSLAKGGFVRKVTEAMSWIKPRLALAVLQMGYHFFMSDLDLSFNLHPISYLLQPNLDIAHQCDGKGKLSINSGFYFARSNQRVIRFFHNIMTLTPEENSDQTAMKLFAKYDKTHSISHNCLDRKLFNMKCYYKVDGSVKVIDGKETFEWYKMDRDRSTFGWAILHATCLAGALPKLVYLRTMNAWFLDDLDRYTSGLNVSLTVEGGGGGSSKSVVPKKKKDAYCLQPPGGEEKIQQSAVIQTIHSPKYHLQAVDDMFLQSRH